jgi:hypothetical protein
MNTVMGQPESGFRAMWVSMLWKAMAAKGEGYPRSTLKNQPPAGAAGWRGERRGDKVGTTKLLRRLAQKVRVG